VYSGRELGWRPGKKILPCVLTLSGATMRGASGPPGIRLQRGLTVPSSFDLYQLVRPVLTFSSIVVSLRDMGDYGYKE
jgi:hypothetical protein